jgi:hypothetical protein
MRRDWFSPHTIAAGDTLSFKYILTFNWKRSFFFFKMCFYYNELWYDGKISESCHSVCLIMYCRCFFQMRFGWKTIYFDIFQVFFDDFGISILKNIQKHPKKHQFWCFSSLNTPWIALPYALPNTNTRRGGHRKLWLLVSRLTGMTYQ